VHRRLSIAGTKDTVEAGKQLRDMAARLVKDLQVYTSVTAQDIELSQASAREWRAIAESALKDARVDSPTPENRIRLRSVR